MVTKPEKTWNLTIKAKKIWNFEQKLLNNLEF